MNIIQMIQSRAVPKVDWKTAWLLAVGRKCCPRPYSEGQGDFVSGLIVGVSGVTKWAIAVINLLTKSP